MSFLPIAIALCSNPVMDIPKFKADGSSFLLNVFTFNQGNLELTLSDFSCEYDWAKCMSKSRNFGFLLTKVRKNIPISFPTSKHGGCKRWFLGDTINSNDFITVIRPSGPLHRHDITMQLKHLPIDGSRILFNISINTIGAYQLYVFDCGKNKKQVTFHLEVCKYNIMSNGSSDTDTISLSPRDYSVIYLRDEALKIKTPIPFKDLARDIRHSWQKVIHTVVLKNLPCSIYHCINFAEFNGHDILLLNSSTIPTIEFRVDGISVMSPLLFSKNGQRFIYNHFHFTILYNTIDNHNEKNITNTIYVKSTIKQNESITQENPSIRRRNISRINIVGLEVHPYSVDRSSITLSPCHEITCHTPPSPVCNIQHSEKILAKSTCETNPGYTFNKCGHCWCCEKLPSQAEYRSCPCSRNPIFLNNSDPQKIDDIFLDLTNFLMSSSSQWMLSNISWEKSHHYNLAADEDEMNDKTQFQKQNDSVIQAIDGGWCFTSNSSVHVSNFEPFLPAKDTSDIRLGKLRVFSVITSKNFEMISCFRFPTSKILSGCETVLELTMKFYQESQNTNMNEHLQLDVFAINDPSIINEHLSWNQIQQVKQYPYPKAKIYTQKMNQYFNMTIPSAIVHLNEKDFAVCLQVEKPVGWWLALSSSLSSNPPQLHLVCDTSHSKHFLTATSQNFYVGAVLGSSFIGVCISIWLVSCYYNKRKYRRFERLTTSDLIQMVGIGTREDGGDSNGGIVISPDVPSEKIEKVVHKLQQHLNSMENTSDQIKNSLTLSREEKHKLLNFTNNCRRQSFSEENDDTDNDDDKEHAEGNLTDESVEELVPFTQELKSVAHDKNYD